MKSSSLPYNMRTAVLFLLFLCPGLAQTRPDSDVWQGGKLEHFDGHAPWLLGPYKPTLVPPLQLGNSGRMEMLLKGGNLYLSLNDAIALALENNLDVEVQRYGTPIAAANLLSAKAGGALRGVIPSVASGPSSATALTTGSGTTGPNTTSTPTTGTTAATTTSAYTVSSSSSSPGTAQQTGAAVPDLDPYISGIAQFAHISTPESNTIVTGTSELVQTQNTGQVSYNQSFLTGTSYSLGYSDIYSSSNSYSSLINPSRTASLTFAFNQELLQGFGFAVNDRFIVQARNNIEYADLQFRLQVITTIVSVEDLYWDLVYFLDDVKAKQEALAYNQTLYTDNKKQVEVGTLAPLEIVRAEAAVASAQQDLIISQTRVLQQETTLKSYLSRTGVESPLIASAHVIATDRIRIPDQEQIQPIQDLTALALSSRPEIAEQRITVQNAKVNSQGSKSALLPTLNLFGSLGNNGLSGTPNAIVAPGGGVATRGTPDPFFIGGYGSLLGQLFRRDFPNYAVGLNLTIPLRNRSAQAQYILDQITVRQQQAGLQGQQNQVRLDVQNALIGVEQARAIYEAAAKARILTEQTLDAERKKLKLGASTVFNVISDERDLAAAVSAEIQAQDTYAKARVELERSTGQVLVNHNISLTEAFKGHISTAPAAVP